MVRSHRIRLFESSIEKLGRILSNRWKIRVIFKHGECKTSGSDIYLPTLPDNASQELLDAMQGHLDHETAHVVYTDFKALSGIKRRDKKVYLVTNALEDPRVERKFSELWRGSRVNLRRSREWSLEKVTAVRDLTDANGNPIKARPWDQLSDFGKVVYAATVYAQVDFDRDHWFVKDVVEKGVMDKVLQCEDLIRRACSANDTKDVVDCAREFMKKLGEEEEPVEYVDPEDVEDDAIILPPQAKGEDKSAMFKKSEKKEADPNSPPVYQAEIDDEDICEACGGSGEDEDGDSCEECGGTGMSADGAEDGEDGSGAYGEGDEDEDGEGGGTRRHGSAQPSPVDGDHSGGARRPDFTGVSNEELQRDAELVNREQFLKEAAVGELSGRDRYMVYTTEGDEYEPIRDGDRVAYKRFMMEANQMVSVIKRKMARSLLSSNISRWEGDKTRGKINPRAVFRVPLGTSKRVFREKVEAEDFNTAVEIMVDHSGSMCGSKLDLASKTAVVLGEVLHQLDIPFSILGFSTGDWDVAEGRRRKGSDTERQMYTRWGNLWIGVYKDYDEAWPRVNHRVMNMVRNERANTYDGESLRYGAQRLARRPEQRKILFWLNDGSPCPNGGDDGEAHRQYAADCAKEVEKMVELMAVGIMTDAVKRYYKNYVVVNNISELPVVCLNELDALLRKGKMLRAA